MLFMASGGVSTPHVTAPYDQSFTRPLVSKSPPGARIAARQVACRIIAGSAGRRPRHSPWEGRWCVPGGGSDVLDAKLLGPRQPMHFRSGVDSLPNNPPHRAAANADHMVR
jgi:hypothetical protein